MSKILLVYEDYAELMSVEAALKKVGFDTIGITHEFSIPDQVISFNPDVVIGSGRSGKVTSLGVGRRLKEMSRWGGKTILIFASNHTPAGPDLIKIRSDIILEAPVPPLRLIQVLAKILDLDEAVLLERLNKMIHSESGSSGPAFSTAKGSSGKADNVRFVVGGGSPENSGTTAVGGPSFNRAPEDEKGEGETAGKRPSLFTHLRGREDLYREEVKGEASEENLFAEVDLKSLETELTGTPATEASSDAKPEPTAETPAAGAAEELEKAKASLKDRVARYAKYLEQAPPAPGQLTRVEARRRQRELAKDWDAEKLKDLDSLRREFTKALYKK